MARRWRKDTGPSNIQRVWPKLGWKECHCCGVEFRREWGWSYEMLGGGHYHYLYFCSGCCQGWEMVESKLKARPIAPPAPPPPRDVRGNVRPTAASAPPTVEWRESNE